MLSNPDACIAYTSTEVWNRLATLMEQRFEARPSRRYGRVDCPPDWQWHPRLSDFDLWFVVRGSGTFQLGQHCHALHGGTLLFLRPGDTGWATQNGDDPLTVIYIHLDFYIPGQNRQAEIDGAWLPSRYVPFGDAAAFELLLMRVVRLMDTRRAVAEFEAKLVVQQALLEVYRQDAANQGMIAAGLDARIDKVITHVRNHPDVRLSLEQAAALSTLSPDYFSRLFKSTTGTSYREYVLQTRLERARYFLEETDLPVGQIARLLGYDDIFLFSRQFKQHYGYPPSKTRK